MRRFFAISASFCLLASLFLGCTRKAKNNEDEKSTDPAPIVKIEPKKEKEKEKVKQKEKIKDVGPIAKPDEDKKNQYEAALGDALIAVRDRKWVDALASFEIARGFASSKDDTEFVQGEIAKVKLRVDQDSVAKTTVKNIETVLNDGNADDASKLANAALKEFGDRDEADQIVRLSLQAEAIKAAQKNEDKDARFTRFKKQAELAREEKNLRAEVLALEQALEVREDAGLKDAYDAARANLDKYDALRKQAAELRRDPTQLDGALEALKAAAAAWPTAQVRAEIDDLELARQKRRDTISVANFELRSDVGMPDAGSAIADELLPLLKPRFDPIERGQLGQVVKELNLQRGFLDDPKAQQKIGKLANLRYLVVGNVSRLVGVTVRARLVDVQTGLVVQTGKIVAADMDEIIKLVPDLAHQLLMADEDRMKLDGVAAKAVEKAPDNAPVPILDIKAPAPPPPVLDPAPPVPGEQREAAFKVFGRAPQGFVAAPADPLQGQFRNRLLFATVEMGDFLFRARRFAEAKRQFDFALILAPDNFDIQMRLVQIQPFLPPPPPPIAYVPLPRIVFMPFMTLGRPSVVPPSLSLWTPANLSPYFAWDYEVVDPAEVYWYMGRMGLTMQDVMADPNARRWLSRAVGVRYFVFGNCIETASFDVNTYVIDAETGYQVSGATIHVRHTHELKLRLAELALLTRMSTEQQAAYLAAKQRQDFVRFVAEGRRHMDEGRYRKALDEFSSALQIYPDIQVQMWQIICQERLRFEEFNLARRGDFEKSKAIEAARQQRQWQLAQDAELARRHALAEAAGRSEGERKAHLRLRIDAQSGMVTRAQIALKAGRFGLSVSFFQGATNMPVGAAPTPVPAVVYQDFAKARYEAEKAEQLRAAQFSADRNKRVASKLKDELVQTRVQLESERKASEAKLDAVRAAQTARDEKAYNASITEGRGYMTKKKYEAALASFQAARRFASTSKQTEQVNTYVDVIVQEQAEELAKTDPQRKKDFETKLAAESESKKAAQQNDKAYKLALDAGQQALAAKNYATAQTKFEAAGQIFMTDAVQSGLRDARAALANQAAESKRVEAEKNKSATIKQLIAAGTTAYDAKNYTAAVQAFRDAKKLDPANLDVIAGLTRAEQASAHASASSEDAARAHHFDQLLKSGQENLAKKRYEAAVANLSEAVKLNPTDASAKTALAQAQKALDATLTDAKAQAAAKQRAERYQKLLSTGKLALDGKRYTEAIKAFGDAQALLPGDKASQDLLHSAQSAKKADDDAATAAAKDKQLKADFQSALSLGQKALQAKNYDAAINSAKQALKLMPKDALALALLQRAQDAADLAAKTGASFQKALDAGKSAMMDKKYAAAVKSFTEATKLDPTDKTARMLLTQAQTALADANTQAMRLASFTKAMTLGESAMKVKRYPDAVKSFKDALKLFPDDQKAQTQLELAQQLLKDSTKVKTPDPVKDFKDAMERGAAAEKDQKYADAAKAFADALKLQPKDKEAQAGWRKNQFSAYLDKGQQYLDNAMFKEAEREFSAALQIFPGNNQATKLLEKAKAKKK